MRLTLKLIREQLTLETDAPATPKYTCGYAGSVADLKEALRGKFPAPQSRTYYSSDHVLESLTFHIFNIEQGGLQERIHQALRELFSIKKEVVAPLFGGVIRKFDLGAKLLELADLLERCAGEPVARHLRKVDLLGKMMLFKADQEVTPYEHFFGHICHVLFSSLNRVAQRRGDRFFEVGVRMERIMDFIGRSLGSEEGKVFLASIGSPDRNSTWQLNHKLSDESLGRPVVFHTALREMWRSQQAAAIGQRRK